MSKAVMTIHGFLTDTEDFGRLYEYLDGYDEVKACEIPGHNGKPDFSKFTVESALTAVLSCYDELRSRNDEVDVVGFSMGGALCSYLCAKRDVHKAVMVSPSNRYFNVVSPISSVKFYLSEWRKIYSSAEGSIKERISAAKNAFVPYKENVATSSRIALKRILPNISLHTFDVFRKLMVTVNKALDESTVDTPSMIMWGKLDELVPRASSEYLQKRFTNTSVKIYKNVGHAMLLTNLDNVLIADILYFLSDGNDVREIPVREKNKD